MSTSRSPVARSLLFALSGGALSTLFILGAAEQAQAASPDGHHGAVPGKNESGQATKLTNRKTGAEKPHVSRTSGVKGESGKKQGSTVRTAMHSTSGNDRGATVRTDKRSGSEKKDITSTALGHTAAGKLRSTKQLSVRPSTDRSSHRKGIDEKSWGGKEAEALRSAKSVGRATDDRSGNARHSTSAGRGAGGRIDADSAGRAVFRGADKKADGRGREPGPGARRASDRGEGEKAGSRGTGQGQELRSSGRIDADSAGRAVFRGADKKAGAQDGAVRPDDRRTVSALHRAGGKADARPTGPVRVVPPDARSVPGVGGVVRAAGRQPVVDAHRKLAGNPHTAVPAVLKAGSARVRAAANHRPSQSTPKIGLGKWCKGCDFGLDWLMPRVPGAQEHGPNRGFKPIPPDGKGKLGGFEAHANLSDVEFLEPSINAHGRPRQSIGRATFGADAKGDASLSAAGGFQAGGKGFVGLRLSGPETDRKVGDANVSGKAEIPVGVNVEGNVKVSPREGFDANAEIGAKTAVALPKVETDYGRVHVAVEPEAWTGVAGSGGLGVEREKDGKLHLRVKGGVAAGVGGGMGLDVALDPSLLPFPLG